jgi:predicted metal-dependent HD superfamily phosphohydrolase
VVDEPTLLDDWAELVGAAHIEAGRQLLARWREPQRRYHAVAHLVAVLNDVALLEGKGAVRLAAWFHDAIYWPVRNDNEARSAELAASTLSLLDVDQSTCTEVVRLVHLTTTHDPPPGDNNAMVLCDADLAILGAPPERYRRYATDIRAEYGHLDDDAFAAGRTHVLARLLQRPRLFHTPEGSRRWEATARANLTAELAVLAGAADQLPEA